MAPRDKSGPSLLLSRSVHTSDLFFSHRRPLNCKYLNPAALGQQNDFAWLDLHTTAETARHSYRRLLPSSTPRAIPSLFVDISFPSAIIITLAASLQVPTDREVNFNAKDDHKKQRSSRKPLVTVTNLLVGASLPAQSQSCSL